MQQEKCYRFQSTLPLWGATGSLNCAVVGTPISIHAPLAGSDDTSIKMILGHANFNPRSPCGERRIFGGGGNGAGDFNPRSPCGERRGKCGRYPQAGYFNPRSPCGERRCYLILLDIEPKFQSTLPLRGATNIYPRSNLLTEFQSTLPLRGATIPVSR